MSVDKALRDGAYAVRDAITDKFEYCTYRFVLVVYDETDMRFVSHISNGRPDDIIAAMNKTNERINRGR